MEQTIEQGSGSLRIYVQRFGSHQTNIIVPSPSFLVFKIIFKFSKQSQDKIRHCAQFYYDQSEYKIYYSDFNKTTFPFKVKR